MKKLCKTFARTNSRLVSLLLAAVLCLSLLPAAAFAEGSARDGSSCFVVNGEEIKGDQDQYGDGWSYRVSDKRLYIDAKWGNNMVVSGGTEDNPVIGYIKAGDDNASTKLTLRNLVLKNSDNESPLQFSSRFAEGELILEGKNHISSVNSSSVSISSDSDNQMKISGSGSLTATSETKEGISVACRNFIVEGGASVTAIGRSYGISSDSVKNMWVKDATVTATGKNGKGISLDNGPVNLAVEGGTVTATGTRSGISIGSGALRVSSGTVTATATSSGCGISFTEYYGDLTVSGGTVTATATGTNAGIEGANIITVNGGTVNAIGGNVGINSKEITVNGGTVTATGTELAIKGYDNISGVVFENDAGKIYGDSVTPISDFAVPTNMTLTVEPEQTLTIPAGVTLTNNGEIINNGKIKNYGRITGNRVQGNQPILPSAGGEWFYIPSTKPEEQPEEQPEIRPENPFTDVPDGAYYAEAVKWAVERNITTGTSDATFSPMKDCTQSEILMFLYRANRGDGTASAEDMAAAVEWAKENGMAGEAFDEGEPCTRATAVEFIWQAVGKPAAEDGGFTDVPADAEYAQAVAWAVENGVTDGTGNGAFSPDRVCNRAQIVTFLYRYFGK